MRDIMPYIFWPWLMVSVGILVHRRTTTGTWRPGGADGDDESSDGLARGSRPEIEFPPPPPVEPVFAASSDEGAAQPAEDKTTVPDSSPAAAPTPEPAFATPPTPTAAVVDPGTPTAIDDRPAARSLAEALEGISMPCDLAPLMGTGEADPRNIAFFGDGVDPAAVGRDLADEFERLGFAIAPLDHRTIRAVRGGDHVQARIVSATLDSALVMAELHPSAPSGAVVVEFELSR